MTPALFVRSTRSWIGFAIAAFGALVVFGGLTQSASPAPAPHRASGAWPRSSGSSSGPLLDEVNTGTGDAIDATGSKNYGIVGRTLGATATAAKWYGGVGGVDMTAGTKRSYNVGVFGTSQNGVGILGQTAFNGWTTGANSLFTAGVYGADNSTKTVDGYSLEAGVFGTSHFGLGVEGVASQGTGVYGSTGSTSALGFAAVEGIDTNATAKSNNAGVYGFSSADVGIFAETSTGVGMDGRGDASGVGVQATSHGTGTALRLVAFADGLLASASNGKTDVMSLDRFGNLILAGTLAQKGSPHISRDTSQGTTVTTRALETTTATIEDVGEAKLVDGHALVPLAGDFARTIDPHTPYLVFVTPEGLVTGTLCVLSRNARGFMVAESDGGHSEAAFAYRIVARPFGEPASRLAAVPIPARGAPDRPEPHLALKALIAPSR